MSERVIRLPEVVIDTHCHGRDMRQSYKTTVYQTLLEAMLAGIMITVFMPNTEPPITTLGALDNYLRKVYSARLRLKNPFKQYVYFGATNDNYKECRAALEFSEVVGIKVYPKSQTGKVVTTGSIGVSSNVVISNLMKLARRKNKVITLHCDDPEIIAKQGHTIEAEASYVEKIIGLARRVPGVRVVICHISCIESAELILQAQNEGLKIAIELMPHYLWFDADGTNWNPKLNPVFYHCYNKLRGREHREYLVSLLKLDNPLIIIGSDNAPHTREEKLEKGLGGIPSNQEMVPVILTLAQELGLSNNQIARLLCWNASKFLNIPIPCVECPRKYRLEERVDDLKYNHGKVENPWRGSKLLFPVPI